MKILAIRGKNLASLADEFALDFQQPPLANAGLFAICGATGSGKSTLLDAMCVALYEQIPRLSNAVEKVPDSDTEEKITAKDVRNLLRRGAGEGFAEVDFVGKDAVRYRTRWSVRRARGKSSGRLQESDLSLMALDSGQLIGDKKTEVRDLIAERIGLSFQQFTRSVLLAQNEFTAFLKAPLAERGKLLTDLTGLDIYTALSKRAFERAKHERQQLDNLRQQLGAQKPLDAEERQALTEDLAAAQLEVNNLEERKAQLTQQQDWHKRWRLLQDEQQKAQATLQKAELAQQAAAPRQQELRRVEAVQLARPLLENVQRSSAQVQRNTETLRHAETQLAGAQSRHTTEQAAANCAAQALEQERQRTAQAQDELQQARSLDAELNILLPNHQAAERRLHDAEQAESAAQQEQKNLQQQQQRHSKQVETTQSWLAEHQQLQRLADEWSRWDEVLQQAASLHSKLEEHVQQCSAATQDVNAKQRICAQTAEDYAAAQTALQTVDAELAQAVARLSGFDGEALAIKRDKAQIRSAQLTQAELLWNRLHQREERHAQAEQEQCGIQERLATARAELVQLAAARPSAEARLHQAEQSLQTVELACAASVEELRERLEKNCPCPVCGATEHPYAQGAAPSHALVAQFRTTVAECREALKQIDTQTTTQQTSVQHEEKRLTALRDEQAKLLSEIERERGAWQLDPLCNALEDIAAVERSTWLASQSQQLQQELEDLAQQEQAQRKSQQCRDQAQQRRDQAQQRQDLAQQAQHAAALAQDKAVQSLQKLQERQTDWQTELAQRLESLDQAFPNYEWRPLWTANPAAFHAERQGKVTHWHEQHRQLEQGEKAFAELTVALRTQSKLLAEKVQQRENAAAEFKDSESGLQTKRQQRQAVCAGQAVEQVEAQLAQALKKAEDHQQRQQDLLQKAVHDQAIQAATVQREQMALGESKQAMLQARSALQDWLTKHADTAPDIATLAALLAHDSAWLEREREFLQELSRALQHEQSIFQERQRQLREHEQQRHGTECLELEAVLTMQEQVQVQLADIQKKAAELTLRLRQDQERCTASAELQDRLTKQQSIADLWNQLSDLIGSADGNKFSNYVQQYVLDVLLGYANQHLADLSRRYRLERIADSLGLLVIDRDMGDQRRSVYSLSGGESFLASLALALGLASLSAQRMPVESLFIDEGFGSLDAESLRVAMDALDLLQAQGRTVGIISHVEEMSERIGVQIRVQRRSGGSSQIVVSGF